MPAPERDEPVLAEDLSHDIRAPIISPDSQDTGDVLKTINTPSPVPASPTFDEHASDDRGGIEAIETSLQQQPALGRHLRQRQQSIKLKDYVLHTVQHLSPSSRPSSCSHAQSLPAGSPYPILDYVNCNNFSIRHCAFLAAITAGVEPASFAEAVRDPRWREAMKSELQALENNNTWTVVSLPPGKRAIGCKWVYWIKYNADGTIEIYKAHLVILGNKQVEGIDYTETFASVVKLVTV